MCDCCGLIFDTEGNVIGHQDCVNESPQSEQLSSYSSYTPQLQNSENVQIFAKVA